KQRISGRPPPGALAVERTPGAGRQADACAAFKIKPFVEQEAPDRIDIRRVIYEPLLYGRLHCSCLSRGLQRFTTGAVQGVQWKSARPNSALAKEAVHIHPASIADGHRGDGYLPGFPIRLGSVIVVCFIDASCALPHSGKVADVFAGIVTK